MNIRFCCVYNDKNGVNFNERLNGKLIMIFIIGMFLSGCESKSSVRPLPSTAEVKLAGVLGDRLDDVEEMERCRRELETLKKVDLTIYSKRKAEFDKLMSGALLYNGVRSNVRSYTQSAVDALYRFRSDKLCADIANDILQCLSK